MKVIPHVLHFVGFFDDLNLNPLVERVYGIVARKDDLFSLGADPRCGSVINCFCTLITATETIVPETYDEKSLTGSVTQMLQQQWLQAELSIEHGLRTLNGGLPVPGRFKSEHFKIKIDREEGTCEITCRFRELSASEEFLGAVVKDLNLSDKPIKHSREVPQWLETKLLCDSLHRCNICSSEGVIIHHIKPVEEGGKTVEDNLIVICPKDHRRVHTKSNLAKNMKPEHLREYKKRHLQWVAERGNLMPSSEK